MTNPPPPSSANGFTKILIWFLTGVVLLISALPGLFQVAEGFSGRETVVSGPVGTFTPVDKSCNRGGCALVGTFTADDGTITQQDVVLNRDALRLRRSDPIPTVVDDVRLGPEGFSRTYAYTTDYPWRWAVAKGVMVAVFGPVVLLVAIAGIQLWSRRSRR